MRDVAPRDTDPQYIMKHKLAAGGCGVGAELVLLMPLLARRELRRRLR
jgi:hypothetical protein